MFSDEAAELPRRSREHERRPLHQGLKHGLRGIALDLGMDRVDEEPPPERKQQRRSDPKPERERHHAIHAPATRVADDERLHDRQIGPAVEDARAGRPHPSHWPYPGILIDFSHLCMSHTRNPTSTR